MVDPENTKSAAEQAWDKLMAGADEAPVETETPAEAAPAEEAAPVEAEAAEEAPQKSERARNPDGTFAQTPKEKADAAAAKTAKVVKPTPSAMAQGKAAPVEAKPAAPAVEALKPPNSLKPTEREAFARAPRELQDFIIRRERDAAINHQRLAETAKRGEVFGQAVAPFESTIRARGAEPVAHVRSLLQAEHTLQYGTRQQKAQVIHTLLSGYGVDVDDVNALLEGKAAPQAMPQQPQPQRPAGMTPEQVEQLLEQREAARHISEFAKAHPYFEQLRPRMSALIEAHARSGLPLELEDAYNLACQSDPEVKAALARTKPAASAVSPSKVRAAAGSLKSRPLSPQPSSDKRSAAEQAWDALTGGGQ